MKNFYLIACFLSMAMFLGACGDDENIDTEKPEVDMSAADAFPVACDTLYFGESFTVTALLTDNVELGSYNIDIHHNFDHHTHSTEVEECNLADQKTPNNPYVIIQDYEIPEGSQSYETNLVINLPSSDGDGSFDEGDYHFHLNLVDAEGWSTPYGVGVKILHRQ